VLAAEFNRMLARLRDHRKSDYGRLLIEQKKSDAVIDAIYEPVICHRCERPRHQGEPRRDSGIRQAYGQWEQRRRSGLFAFGAKRGSAHRAGRA
jgi:hypothetical protein